MIINERQNEKKKQLTTVIIIYRHTHMHTWDANRCQPAVRRGPIRRRRDGRVGGNFKSLLHIRYTPLSISHAAILFTLFSFFFFSQNIYVKLTLQTNC